MDERLSEDYSLSDIEQLSVISQSKRWPFSWCGCFRPSQVTELAVPRLFLFKHGETSECCEAFVTKIEFHCHFFVYSFSLSLIGRYYDKLTPLRRTTGLNVNPVAQWGSQYVFHNYKTKL